MPGAAAQIEHRARLTHQVPLDEGEIVGAYI
jgi:hypothetical protein